MHKVAPAVVLVVVVVVVVKLVVVIRTRGRQLRSEVSPRAMLVRKKLNIDTVL
jgi:membrane protein YdbS with pleckstrin-like domain